jgi:hypothetical protein
MPQVRRKRRTNDSGPLIASRVARRPKTIVQMSGIDRPKACLASASAESRITITSNEPQPTSCTALSTAGTDAPRTPSVGRNDDMAASPVSVPITPASASSTTPITLPMPMAASACGSDSPGTSSAPAWATKRPMPSENHSAKASPVRNARRASGTGVSGA